MRNKSKWSAVLFIGLALLLVGSLVGCSESYTEDDLNNSCQQGYDSGHSAGYDVGYDAGYGVGYTEGYNEGHDTGYDEGIEYAREQCGEAFEQGYAVGYQDALTEIPADFWFPSSYNVGNGVADFFIEVISLTSPVNPGEYATIQVRTLSNEVLDIEVWYMSGESEAQGLGAKRADNEGYVSWTWKVGTRTMPGTWPIIVASLNFDWWFQGYENIIKTFYIDVVAKD